MLFRNIVIFAFTIVNHRCQKIRQNDSGSVIVFPKIAKRFKRETRNDASIQLDIDGQNESENFSLHLKKNANLVTRRALVEWHHPNGTKQILNLYESNVSKKSIRNKT